MPAIPELALLLSPLLWALTLAILALAAGGASAARLAGGGRGGELLRLAFAPALGLGLLAQALLLCGLGGRFGAGAVAAVALVTLLLGRRALAACGADLSALARQRREPRWRHALPAVAALAGPAWLALYPPVAWDDTVYHLPLARSLAEQGRYLFVENLRAPVFPLLAETIFAPALLVGRASTAHGVALLATAGTALLLVAWSREVFAGTAAGRGPEAWTLVPAAIWIGQPIVVFYAGSSFVDPLLTLFVTAAAYAFARWRAAQTPAWLLASGALAGWAAATKYLGLYLVAALAVAAFLLAPPRGRAAALARFSAAAALAAGPWYALIWGLSGNPLFPFLSRCFGETEWSGLTAIARSGLPDSWAARCADLLRLGWDLVADRRRVGLQPPFSPLVVAAFPLLAYLAWRRPRWRVWIGLVGGFVAAFLFLPRDARYLMPYSPLLTLLLVAALRDLLQEVPASRSGLGSRRLVAARWASLVLVVAGLAPGPAYALWRTLQSGPPPVTAAAVDQHLAQRVPLYRALLFRRAAGLTSVRLYALHGERLHDFAGAALLGDWAGPYRFSLILPLLAQPEALAGELRRLGAAELLLPRTLVAPEVVAAIAGSPRFRELYRDDEAVLLALESESSAASSAPATASGENRALP